MKRILLVLSATLLTLSLSCTKSRELSLETLLDDMTNPDLLTTLPDPWFTQAQVSSHDRRSVSPDAPYWFANRDWTGVERADTVGGRVEKVLFDEQGPGVITRIWMTTKGKEGVMRFYFDGSQDPEITLPAYDMKRFPVDIPYPLSMTHTHYEEAMDGVGGNTFFLPLPYAKSCKVTFEEMSPESPRYYQINYRTYEPGTTVKTVSLKQIKAAKGLMEKVCKNLVAEPVCEGRKVTSTDSLKLGTSKGEVVRRLDIRVKGFENYAEDMEKIIVCASFDGITTVEVPLSHLSGAGLGAGKVDSRYLFSDGEGHVAVYYPMPYRHEASIRVVNRTPQSLSVELSAIVDDYKWTPNSLYLHCFHKEEDGVRLGNDYDSADNVEWNFITITGKGNYCGDLLSLYNHAPQWYGEGDEKIYVDGESFPSHFGTGTEDYYNCSWAPVVEFCTPFGGATCSEDPTSHGRNTFLRNRILDVIPFHQSFRYDLEMLSWVPGTADMRSTAFWYGDAQSKAK